MQVSNTSFKHCIKYLGGTLSEAPTTGELITNNHLAVTPPQNETALKSQFT